jgi:hypothetical protein
VKSRVNIIFLPLFVATLLHVVVATGQLADSISDADRFLAQGEALFTSTASTEQLQEAFGYYMKAAELGSAAAQHRVGVAYATGRGVQKDESEAMRWYQKSVAGGFADAQCDLGVRYLHGQGVRKDEQTGLMLIKRAAVQGYPEAIDILKDRGIKLADGDVDKKYDDSAGPPSQLSTDGPTHGENDRSRTMESIDGQDEASQEKGKQFATYLALAVSAYMTRKGENDSFVFALIKRGFHTHAKGAIEDEINARLSGKSRLVQLFVKALILNILDGRPSIREIALTTGSNELLALLNEPSPTDAAERDVSDLLDAFDVWQKEPSFNEMLQRFVRLFAGTENDTNGSDTSATESAPTIAADYAAHSNAIHNPDPSVPVAVGNPYVLWSGIAAGKDAYFDYSFSAQRAVQTDGSVATEFWVVKGKTGTANAADGRFPTEDLAGSHKFSESEEENFKTILPGATNLGTNPPIDWQERADQWMAVPVGVNARIAVRQMVDTRQVYTVAGIPPDPDGGPPFLNVRTGPGANFPSLVKLPGGYNQIHIIGTQFNGTTEWAHIIFERYSGWVNKKYLKAE